MSYLLRSFGVVVVKEGAAAVILARGSGCACHLASDARRLSKGRVGVVEERYEKTARHMTDGLANYIV